MRTRKEYALKFYLQDKRQFVGNDMLWWRKGGGYTCNIAKAEVFTKEKAFKQHAERETDVPWPKRYIDERIIGVVGMQYCDREVAIQSIK